MRGVWVAWMRLGSRSLLYRNGDSRTRVLPLRVNVFALLPWQHTVESPICCCFPKTRSCFAQRPRSAYNLNNTGRASGGASPMPCVVTSVLFFHIIIDQSVGLTPNPPNDCVQFVQSTQCWHPMRQSPHKFARVIFLLLSTLTIDGVYWVCEDGYPSLIANGDANPPYNHNSRTKQHTRMNLAPTRSSLAQAITSIRRISPQLMRSNPSDLSAQVGVRSKPGE